MCEEAKEWGPWQEVGRLKSPAGKELVRLKATLTCFAEVRPAILNKSNVDRDRLLQVLLAEGLLAEAERVSPGCTQ